MIIVMVVILVLAGLAGAFAYSMKVETQLARNNSFESDFQWLGRSGVELARYVLAMELQTPAGQVTCLNQKWAGGSADTNEVLAAITLENNQLGPGSFSIKMIDQERKININIADTAIMQRALGLMEVDVGSFAGITDSILDWRDRDDDRHLSGAESDDYLNLSPAYYAKNGPIDDISELLLINGITPEMFWGSGHGSAGARLDSAGRAPVIQTHSSRSRFEEMTYAVGLVDIFTAIGERTLNLNTASAEILRILPGVDENVAASILTTRAGPDGVEGTEDDTPFRGGQDLNRVPGLNPQIVAQMSGFAGGQSVTFEVQVDVQIDRQKRRFIAMLRRNSPRDVAVLYEYWK